MNNCCRCPTCNEMTRSKLQSELWDRLEKALSLARGYTEISGGQLVLELQDCPHLIVDIGDILSCIPDPPAESDSEL